MDIINTKNSRALRAVMTLTLLGAMTQLTMAGGKSSKYTADFYRAQYDAYNGKDITVKVTHVKPFHRISNIPELRFFLANTYDDREKIVGGHIIVAIPTGIESEFIKKYGTSPEGLGKGRKGLADSETEKLSGILRADGRRLMFIDFGGQAKEIIDARLQEILKKLPSDEGAAPAEGDSGSGADASAEGSEGSENADKPQPRDREPLFEKRRHRPQM